MRRDYNSTTRFRQKIWGGFPFTSVGLCSRQCTRSTLQNNFRLQLGDEIADVRRVFLFARGFRRGRGNEFFEAGIFAKRVPDGIEFEKGNSDTAGCLQ